MSIYLKYFSMNNKDFIKIINEEIKKFDFLSNDEFLKEQESNELLLDADLQKQFICDALLNKNDKVKIIKIEDSRIGGNWDESHFENADSVSLDYNLNMSYQYDSLKEPLLFNLTFQADSINISVDGWQDGGNWGGTMGDAIEPSGDAWYNSFDWSDISVNLWTTDGQEIKFIAFEKAPPRIKTLFIRHYTQNFIESKTLELRTPEIKDKVQDVPYC